jgi:hypothetical protein
MFMMTSLVPNLSHDLLPLLPSLDVIHHLPQTYRLILDRAEAMVKLREKEERRLKRAVTEPTKLPQLLLNTMSRDEQRRAQRDARLAAKDVYLPGL